MFEPFFSNTEKNGFRLAADILENYGIDSETDLSVFDQDEEVDSTTFPNPDDTRFFLYFTESGTRIPPFYLLTFCVCYFH